MPLPFSPTKNVTLARQSLLLLAWYAQTQAGDAALSSFAADATKPAVSRAYARELIGRNGQAGLLAAATALLRSEASLRSERRELMKRLSDEALIELDQTTAQLAAKRK